MKEKSEFFSGYIEGYFGRVLSWSQRYGIIEKLADLGMNSYLYAPKEDPYHRIRWRDAFPGEWESDLRDLAAYAAGKGVSVIPALAPGLSYHYCKNDDFDRLLGKFQQLFALGMKKVALLMDDIPLELPQNCSTEYRSLGEAHGKLLKRLLSELRQRDEEIALLFCPSVYSDQFVQGRAAVSEYILDLKADMPEEIPLFWTGDRIIAQTMDDKSCGDICELFGHNVIFWDNLYANDYAPGRLFIGSFEGRDLSFITSNSGIMINPTGLYETDKFLLHHLADFLSGKSDLASCWEEAADAFAIPGKLNELKEFFWLPYSPVEETFFNKAAIERIGNIYDELIVPWVHPLKLEWYSWLMGLYLDFENVRLDKRQNPGWLQQRYSPVVAHMLARK